MGILILSSVLKGLASEAGFPKSLCNLAASALIIYLFTCQTKLIVCIAVLCRQNLVELVTDVVKGVDVSTLIVAVLNFYLQTILLNRVGLPRLLLLILGYVE